MPVEINFIKISKRKLTLSLADVSGLHVHALYDSIDLGACITNFLPACLQIVSLAEFPEVGASLRSNVIK